MAYIVMARFVRRPLYRAHYEGAVVYFSDTRVRCRGVCESEKRGYAADLVAQGRAAARARPAVQGPHTGIADGRVQRHGHRRARHSL